MNVKYDLAISLTEDGSLTAYRQGDRRAMILDRSGGYGSPLVPLSMTWLPDEACWMPGKVHGSEHIPGSKQLENLLEDIVGRKADGRLLTEYIVGLSDFLSQVDPNSIIKSLSLSIPREYVAYENVLIKALKEKMTCPVSVHSQEEAVGMYIAEIYPEISHWLWLHYSAAGLEVYSIDNDGGLRLKRCSCNEAVSLGKIKGKLRYHIQQTMMTAAGTQRLEQAELQAAEEMTDMYLPQLFRQMEAGKALKLTFNHTFPPFQGVMTQEVMDGFMSPVRQGLEMLFGSMSDRKAQGWLLTGEGFRHTWVRNVVKSCFHGDQKVCQESSVLGLLYGLGANSPVIHEDLAKWDYGFLIEDDQQEIFVPWIGKGHWLYGQIRPLTLMLGPGERQEIHLYERRNHETMEVVASCSVYDTRENQPTRLKMDLKYSLEGFHMKAEKVQL